MYVDRAEGGPLFGIPYCVRFFVGAPLALGVLAYSQSSRNQTVKDNENPSTQERVIGKSQIYPPIVINHEENFSDTDLVTLEEVEAGSSEIKQEIK